MSVGPLYPGPLASTPNLVTIRFRFQSAGATTTDPDFIFPSGCGVGFINQTASGVFTVAFNTIYPAMVGCVGAVHEADEVNDLIVKCGIGDYNTTTGVLTVTTVGALDTTSAATAVTADDWVYLECTFVQASSDAVTGASVGA